MLPPDAVPWCEACRHYHFPWVACCRRWSDIPSVPQAGTYAAFVTREAACPPPAPVCLPAHHYPPPDYYPPQYYSHGQRYYVHPYPRSARCRPPVCHR